MLQQFAQISSAGMAFRRQSPLGSKQMSIYRMFIAICLCGFLLVPFGAAKAQGLVEYALILVYAQPVDVNGNGTVEDVEGRFQLDANGVATGYLSVQTSESLFVFTAQTSGLWCSAAGPAADVRGTLRVRSGSREERFEGVTLTIRPTATANRMWIASAYFGHGLDQGIAFEATGQREFQVDPCGSLP